MDALNRAEPLGWVLYDGECGFCCKWAQFWSPTLKRRGFELAPLQSPWVSQRLGMPRGELLGDIRLLTRKGELVSGADVYLYVMRRFIWTWPLFALFSLPLFKRILKCGYRVIATNRYCISGTCRIQPRRHSRPKPWFESPLELDETPPRRGSAVMARLPVLLLTASALVFGRQFEPWQFMWLLAGAIYFGCKWLTWWPAHAVGAFASRAHSAGYLLLWPGMNPIPFQTAAQNGAPPQAREWLLAIAKTLFGVALVGIFPAYLPPEAATWSALAGVLFVLHFGIFHLLALLWRAAGVDVAPLMRTPGLATSLADFWSARWNTAFRTLAHDEILRPVQRKAGLRLATFAVFLASGLVHELVISVPAGAGYGLPTAYFLLQWLGVAFERSAWGRRAGLQRGIRGWVFVLLATVAPLSILFHAPFVHRVMVPFFHALGALDKGGTAMTVSLENLLRIGGILQLAVLTASALVPKVLDWKRSLAPLSDFLRKMFWVYGAFIAMTIIAFGTLTLAHAGTLADGSPLARSVCAVIAIFWGARLLIQLFVFDIRPLNVHFILRLGYHALTAVFTYLAAIFGYAALAGRI